MLTLSTLFFAAVSKISRRSVMSSNFGNLVGAVDQGTSSSRFLLFSAKTGELVCYHQVEVPRHAPKEGWVEQDANILLNSTFECVEETVKKLRNLGLDPSAVKAIGVTNQRETIIAWDKLNGKPLYNAIVWMDTRTASEVNTILADPKNKSTVGEIRKLCGLPMSTYFSALKMKWMLDNVPAVRNAVANGTCLMGTVDSWLVWNLTGGPSGGLHITDVTNASRTMLMNIRTQKWDPFLCDYFRIISELLPTIKSSSEIYGKLKKTSLAGIPISGILGDQQAALVGQMCFSPGEAKCTFGTACTLLLNTGDQIVDSKHGLLTTVGYKMGPDKPTIYALEGSVGSAGGTIKWLRDNLKIADSYEGISKLSKSVDNCGGVYLVPAFSGLYAPYWRADATGVICGLTEYSTKGHLARAAYEAVAFQAKDVVEAMNQDVSSSQVIKSLKVDGGMTILDELMQLQADILGTEIVRPDMQESTALGAAMAAGAAEGVNVWELGRNSGDQAPKTFRPNIDQKEREQRYVVWKKAVGKSFNDN